MPRDIERRVIPTARSCWLDAVNVRRRPLLQPQSAGNGRHYVRCRSHWRQVLATQPVKSLLPVTDLTLPIIDVAGHRPESRLVIALDLLFIVANFVDAASPRRLRPARDKFDSATTRADLHVGHAVKPVHDLPRPRPQLAKHVKAVVKINARVAVAEFKRQHAEGVCCFEIRPRCRVVGFRRIAVDLNRDLCSVHVSPVVPASERF